MHLFNKENIWSNPHASSIHPVIQTSTIILWTELFPKKRREKISKERYFNLQVQWCFHILQRTTRNPASFQSSRAKKTILHTELILPHEIFKKYYNYKAHPVQTNTRHLPATVPRVSKHSTRQNKAPSSPTAQAGSQQFYPAETAF